LPDGSEHDVTNHTSYTAPATIVGANQFRLRLHDRHPERVIAEAAPSITAIPAPSITRFEASHAAVCHGDQSILSWATAHADTARLVGIGSVPANGAQAVTPTGTTTYTL